MTMTLKADVSEACRTAGMEKPIDLVHLSSLTMGDRDLEIEVLDMFSARTPQYLEMMRSCTDNEQVLRVAHTIKGAASNIGAFQLAKLVSGTEESGIFPMEAIVIEMQRIQDYIKLLSSKA